MSSKTQAHNEAVFKAILERIGANKVLSHKRAEKLVNLMSLTERKKLANKFNRSLAHFKEQFIKNFVGSMSAKGSIQDFTHRDKVGVRGGVKYHFPSLTENWETKKRKMGVATPNFFRFGKSAELLTKRGKKPKKRPKKTLEQYLNENWGNIIEARFGLIKSSDIIFKDAQGRDLTKAAKNAKTIKEGMAALGASNPFVALLKDRKTDFRFTEEITIGFRAFGAYGSKLEGNTPNPALSLELSKLFIPITENKVAKGFPLSKLTNNHETGLKWRGPLRPTLLPLLQWYYNIKLPKILRSHYQRKF